MAEKLGDYRFSRGRVTGSKWLQYLDGEIYRLRVPEDIPSVSGVAMVRKVAKEQGLKIRTATEGVSAVVVQAYKPEDKA